VRREACRLRPLKDGDLGQVLSWRNQPRIRRAMFTDHVITAEEHRLWYEAVRNQDPPPILVYEQQDQAAGVVTMRNYDRANSRCTWGFYLGVDGLPKGSGRRLAFCGLEMLFDEFGLHKVIGEVLADNASSLKLHDALGFKHEGRFARHVLKEGRWEDVITLALFRENWLASKQQLIDSLFTR